MKHLHSKKADLSLSTNAIVILILAITILGLGLTFVRGLFKQAETKVTETFSATELANPPTRDTPITIAPGLLTLREGKSGKATIAHFNPSSKTRYCKLIEGTAGGPAVATILVSNEESTIPREDTNAWVVAVQATTGTGTKLFPFSLYCCDATMGTGTSCSSASPNDNPVVYTKELVVKVES